MPARLDKVLSFVDEDTRRSFMRKSAGALAVGGGVAGFSETAAATPHESGEGSGRGDSFYFPDINLRVQQTPNRSVHWIRPGKRRLSEYTFGTPDDPYMLPDHWIDIADGDIADLLEENQEELPVAGVPLESRVEDGSEFVETDFDTPFSDDAEEVDGRLRVVYRDRQPYDLEQDPGDSDDESDIAVEFEDPNDTEYEIDFKSVYEPPYPNYETGGGVLLGNYINGITGTGTPLEPRQLALGAVWGICDLLIDGDVEDEDRLVRIKTSQSVRNEDYELAITPDLPLSEDDAYLGRDHQTDLLLPPVKLDDDGNPTFDPVSTEYGDQNFIHVVFDEDRITAVTGKRGRPDDVPGDD